MILETCLSDSSFNLVFVLTLQFLLTFKPYVTLLTFTFDPISPQSQHPNSNSNASQSQFYSALTQILPTLIPTRLSPTRIPTLTPKRPINAVCSFNYMLFFSNNQKNIFIFETLISILTLHSPLFWSWSWSWFVPLVLVMAWSSLRQFSPRRSQTWHTSPRVLNTGQRHKQSGCRILHAAAPCCRKSAILFTCMPLKPPCPSYLGGPYQVINVMNGGLMTPASTLFKGSRIEDGIGTCNNAGGAGDSRDGSPEHQCHHCADQALRVLLMHYESPLRLHRASWLLLTRLSGLYNTCRRVHRQ